MKFEPYKEEVEALAFGKQLPDAIYLHKSALPFISDSLAHFTSVLVARYAADLEWDVVKFFRRDFKVSLLCYPTFLSESYPALRNSTTIDLVREKMRKMDYSRSENPPILHRKDTLVTPDHPAYLSFVAINQEGESLGLYKQSSRIGFKKSWERLISSKGYALVDGHIVPKAAVASSETNEEVGSIPIHRHRTAIDRDKLSTPMQRLARHGYLSGDHSVLDYGCGKGHDILELEAHGVDAVGWDPEYRPDGEKRVSDVVNLGFVINVIEERDERANVLLSAFGLTRCVLAISAMIGSETTNEKFTRYKDGVVTSRKTFQKYYSQSELRSFIESTLGRQAFAAAPGIFFVFKDELEEQRFLANRQRVSRSWRQLTAREKSAPKVNYQKLVEDNIDLVQAFWETCLDFGRMPANDEFDRSDEVRHIIGSHKKALDVCASYFGTDDYDKARDGRIEDITVFLALSYFGRRQAYTKMPQSLQRDIKSFFQNVSTAQELARIALFSVANTQKITEACFEARDRLDCGHLQTDHSYVVDSKLLNSLPGILRIYVGCASQLYGDIESVDLIKIHMGSGKVTLMIYEDFGSALPLLKERIKVRLREQEIDWFYYGGRYDLQPLYLKSLYMSEGEPGFEPQQEFDQRVSRLPGIDLKERGPTLSEFQKLLAENSLSLDSLDKK